MDPLSAGVFASIGSAFKFADVAVRIAEVGSENAVFVRAICVVRSDLEEVERLLSLESVLIKLNGTPGKLPWVKVAIQNTRCALNEIGKWVERARVEQETTGSIKFDTRVRWVFNDHEKLLNRKTELSTCHQQLSNVLGYLTGLEDMPVKTVTLECEDTSYLDDILSRHRRSSRPQTSKAKPEVLSSSKHVGLQNICTCVYVTTVHNLSLPGADAARLEYSRSNYPPSFVNVWSTPEAPKTAIQKQYSNERSSPMTSSLSPPGSPPPTYATAISLGPVLHHMPWSSSAQATITQDVAAISSSGRKETLDHTYSNNWAYRSNPDDMNVPELAGDTVSFSATNPAGPVNPYELCTNSEKAVPSKLYAAPKPDENLAEMLGDLHFPAELPSIDPGPPPGYPPRSRTQPDQLGSARPVSTQSRRRTTSEIPPRVHRRPLAANALSDSLLAVDELPPSLAAHNVVSQASSDTSQSVNKSSFATELSSNPPMNERPASYASDRSVYCPQPPLASSNRHYSAPPPAIPLRNEWVAAFSADTTSSWGLDTEPRQPRGYSAQETTKFTRMQTQQRLMDLLGSIDT